jgi:hypothetical protein
MRYNVIKLAAEDLLVSVSKLLESVESVVIQRR